MVLGFFCGKKIVLEKTVITLFPWKKIVLEFYDAAIFFQNIFQLSFKIEIKKNCLF